MRSVQLSVVTTVIVIMIIMFFLLLLQFLIVNLDLLSVLLHHSVCLYPLQAPALIILHSLPLHQVSSVVHINKLRRRYHRKLIMWQWYRWKLERRLSDRRPWCERIWSNRRLEWRLIIWSVRRCHNYGRMRRSSEDMWLICLSGVVSKVVNQQVLKVMDNMLACTSKALLIVTPKLHWLVTVRLRACRAAAPKSDL